MMELNLNLTLYAVVNSNLVSKFGVKLNELKGLK